MYARNDIFEELSAHFRGAEVRSTTFKKTFEGGLQKEIVSD